MLRQRHSQPNPTSLWGSFTCHCGNTEVERTPNKSQHTELTLEKKILPPLLPGLELAAFRSRVQQASPATTDELHARICDLAGTYELLVDLHLSVWLAVPISFFLFFALSVFVSFCLAFIHVCVCVCVCVHAHVRVHACVHAAI